MLGNAAKLLEIQYYMRELRCATLSSILAKELMFVMHTVQILLACAVAPYIYNATAYLCALAVYLGSAAAYLSAEVSYLSDVATLWMLQQIIWRQ